MCKIYFHLHALVYIIHTMSGLPQIFEVGSLIKAADFTVFS